MFQVSQRQAGNLAASRFLLSVLKPWVFRPLRSARFLNRPHDLKFKSRAVSSFKNVDWRDQKWHRMNGSRPMARNLKFGNRAAMTFCATYNSHETCPSSQRKRAVKEPGGSWGVAATGRPPSRCGPTPTVLTLTWKLILKSPLCPVPCKKTKTYIILHVST
jgi:hypothetical protein